MAAGILLGPSFLGRLFPSVEAILFPAVVAPLLQLLSQLGVILFMFMVGMEFDVLRLRERARAAVVISNAGIAVPFALGIVLSLYSARGLRARRTCRDRLCALHRRWR